MALEIIMAPEFKRAVWTQNVNLDTDSFQIYLMDTSLPTYDPTTHINWANVSTHELPTANGYTQGGVTLTGGAVTVDSQYSYRTFNSVNWLSSGSLTVAAAIIVDTTYLNRIVGLINNDDVTVTSGLYYTIPSPTVRI